MSPPTPCVNLPDLDKEYGKTRVLTEDEIRTLWWGLDDPRSGPPPRGVALGLKFLLTTMLRSMEIIAAERSELVAFNTDVPLLRIPLKTGQAAARH